MIFFFLSFSFSGLFGSSNTKDALPKRSTTVKHSSISDQIAPTKSTEEILSSERSINERFEYFLLIIFFDFLYNSATVPEDDTRFEVYGWSLSSTSDEKIQANVPVPVYCRPVFNTNDKTQV